MAISLKKTRKNSANRCSRRVVISLMLIAMAMMKIGPILKQYRTYNSKYLKQIFSAYDDAIVNNAYTNDGHGNGNGIIITNGNSNYSSNSNSNSTDSIIDIATTSTMNTAPVTAPPTSPPTSPPASPPASPPTVAATSKIFGHFLMHIPKSGTSYAFQTLSQLLYPTPEWKNLTKHFRPCDEATKPLNRFKAGGFREQYKGNTCTLWMSEQPFSPVPERVYAIVRDPRSHTLSMYFHCLESRDHRKVSHKMPKSLDTWLDAWVDAKNDTKRQIENHKFACYNPLNFQTRWIGHNFLKKNNNNANIYYNEEDGDTVTNNTGKQQQKQYMYSDKDLKDRYMVLGDNAQMDKSVCMIFIHYTGWVPKRCDCTSKTNVAVNINITDNHFAHGVTHHGSSFQTTPSQDEKIAILRDLDYPLYETSRRIFREQVRIVEDKYNITICDKLLD
jgi:hypothetical protein